MRKTVILLIILSQILWIFNNFIPKEERLDTVLTVKVRGYSGLIRTIYTNLIDNLKKMIEPSDLTPNLPMGNNKNDENDNQQKIILHFYQNLCFNENIKKLEGNINTLVTTIPDIPNYTLNLKYHYSLFWLMIFLFMYLLKLKYYFLKPRSCINDILNNRGIKNPTRISTRVGFFYFCLFVAAKRKLCHMECSSKNNGFKKCLKIK